MKKLFSLFTLLVFITVGFIHNSMMVFAAGENMEMSIEENSMYSIEFNDKNDNKKCFNSCCVEGNIDHGIFSFNNNSQKKISNLTNDIVALDITFFSFHSLDNKNLIKKTSPPYYKRKISNYSYHNLIKIIKSNT